MVWPILNDTPLSFSRFAAVALSRLGRFSDAFNRFARPNSGANLRRPAPLAAFIPSIATIAGVNGETLGADVINNLHPEIRMVITIRTALYQRETAFGVVMHSSENLHELTRLVATASWVWAGMLLRSLDEHRQAA